MTHTDNYPPEVVPPGAQDQVKVAGSGDQFYNISNIFTDAESDPITFSSTQNDGYALPTWIVFDTDQYTIKTTTVGKD